MPETFKELVNFSEGRFTFQNRGFQNSSFSYLGNVVVRLVGFHNFGLAKSLEFRLHEPDGLVISHLFSH